MPPRNFVGVINIISQKSRELLFGIGRRKQPTKSIC